MHTMKEGKKQWERLPNFCFPVTSNLAARCIVSYQSAVPLSLPQGFHFIIPLIIIPFPETSSISAKEAWYELWADSQLRQFKALTWTQKEKQQQSPPPPSVLPIPIRRRHCGRRRSGKKKMEEEGRMAKEERKRSERSRAVRIHERCTKSEVEVAQRGSKSITKLNEGKPNCK